MQMRATAVGIADLQVLEAGRRTPRRLAELSRANRAPEGDAVRVTLTDKGVRCWPLCFLAIPGQSRRSRAVQRCMCETDENQAWLPGHLTPKPNVTDWLDKGLSTSPRDRVKGAVVTPTTGPGYTHCARNKDQPGLQDGRSASRAATVLEGSPDGVAGAILRIPIDDTAKADQLTLPRRPQSVFSTFDGLTITVKIATKA